MDRCALFVDAGYLLADGAMAVHGTRHREAVSWDFGGVLQLLGNLGRERTGLALLRCYWYEATVEGRRGPEHEALADLPGLKLRLGRVRPGRREGVDTEIQRDLLTLARNKAISDAVVVSGDEDLAQVISDAQDLGLRVTVVHVAVDGNWTISRNLRQECDDLIEIGSNHLRPYVNLLAGIDTGALSNGHGTGAQPVAPLQAGSLTGPLSSPPQLGSAAGVPGNGLNTGALGLNTGANGLNTGLNPSIGSGVGSGVGNGLGNGMGNGLSGLGNGAGSGLGNGLGNGMGNGVGNGLSGLGNGVGNGLSGLGNGMGNGLAAQSPLQSTPTPVTPQPGTGPQQYIPGSTTGPLPTQQQQHGPYTGPLPTQGGGQLAPIPAQQNTPTLSDAVKAAHQEGQDFGESVARDAPALWLEAVLARKPRMPSDLEARLLQGSSLPIDFLLHDEVRHALRRGFWDALERSRR